MTALRDLTPLRDVVAESGLEASGKEFVAVALQALRRASMLTPTEFAERANLSLTQVGLAERGTVPWNVLNGYLAAAEVDDVDRRFVHELWQQVQQHDAPHPGKPVDRAEDNSVVRTVLVTTMSRPASTPPGSTSVRRPIKPPCPDITMWPDPARIGTPPEFQLGFATLKNSTGASYARLAKVAEGLGYPLPRTTLHNLCTRPRLPMSAEVVSTFVAACGGDEQTVRAWVAAWQRLRTMTGDAGMASMKQAVSAAEHEPAREAGDDQVRGTVDDDEDAEGRHLDVVRVLEMSASNLVSGATVPGTTVSTRTKRIAKRPSVSAAACASVVWSARTVPLSATVPIATLLFILGLLSGLFTGVTLTH